MAYFDVRLCCILVIIVPLIRDSTAANTTKKSGIPKMPKISGKEAPPTTPANPAIPLGGNETRVAGGGTGVAGGNGTGSAGGNMTEFIGKILSESMEFVLGHAVAVIAVVIALVIIVIVIIVVCVVKLKKAKATKEEGPKTEPGQSTQKSAEPPTAAAQSTGPSVSPGKGEDTGLRESLREDRPKYDAISSPEHIPPPPLAQ